MLHEKLSEAKRQDRLTYEKAFKAYVDSAATGGRHGADLTLFGLLKDLKAKADISEKEVFAEGLKRHQVGGKTVGRDLEADADALLALAEANNDRIHQVMRAFVQEVGGDYLQGPLKSKERIVEKARNDYGEDAMQVLDVIRASGIFDNLGSPLETKRKFHTEKQDLTSH